MISQAITYKGHAVLIWHQFCGDRQTIIPVIATVNPCESNNVRLEPAIDDDAAIAAAKFWIDNNVSASLHFAASTETFQDYLIEFNLSIASPK